MKALLAVLCVVCFSSVGLAATPKVGDKVWAQWKPNAWYHGTIDAPCDWGVHVKFDDGDQGCFPRELVAVDQPIAPANLVPGTRVLAIWSNGKYYPATVTGKPAGGKVDVFFDDRTPFKADIKTIIKW